MTEDEQLEQRRRARALMSEAAALYIDSWDNLVGSLVTSYVAVFEITGGEGETVVWLTGTGGTPDATRSEGLSSWRVEGLIRRVIHDIEDGTAVSE